MATFLRGKQAGMQKDLSANIALGLFQPDDRTRYGINSQVSCIAYDPVQSLLAVGTNESKFGGGRINIFGQSRVHKFLVPSRPQSLQSLQFWANRLISLSTKGEITIWNLDKGQHIVSFHAPGKIVHMVTDPMLDWCFLGSITGELYIYDLDRQRLSPLQLPNFWHERDSKSRGVSLVSMQLHPRDIGKLLIAYNHGVVVYSFKQNQPTQWFQYQVPAGAPGGNGAGVDSMRRPRVTQAVWHPTGTFILTAHDDGSLVFWDAKDGRVVMARTLKEMNVDQPVACAANSGPKHPYLSIAWCCKQNPEDSGLLIAGGQPLDGQLGLAFLDLGITPNYATSTWAMLSTYCQGKRTMPLETPQGAQPLDFFLIPRESPHFSGAQDPIAIMALLSSGEILSMTFPNGDPISPTNQLHPSLSFIAPFATKIAASTLSREQWLGMIEARNQRESFLKGGKVAPMPRRRFEGRTIMQTAHADGTVRLWDVGHGDEIENPSQLQVDIARSLNRYDDISITAMSMGRNGEFAVGVSGGEVIIHRWDGNRFFGKNQNQHLDPNPGGLTDISSRAEPSLKQGLQPCLMYEMMQGPISALKVSEIGFIAVGSESGILSIIDMRGPSVTFQAPITEFAKTEKRTSLMHKHSASPKMPEFPVAIEWGVMSVNEDKFSSICCFVGTNLGKIITFILLPEGNSFKAKFAGAVQLQDRVVSICPIETDTGKPAALTGEIVAGLREGKQVNGLLVVVTRTEARIFKPATAKGASKSFDDYLCDAAAVTEFDLHGMALVGTFGDCVTRAFSLPGLKEIGIAPLKMMDGRRSEDCIVTEEGYVFCWTGPSEIAVLDVWGAGRDIGNTADVLVNPELLVPPRPTISNAQWLSGTQHISPTDLDLLIGGPDRPPSKRMMEATAVELRGASVAGPSMSPQGTGSAEGWGEYLTRQLNERTEKLNLVNDSMDGAADSSQKWAEDASKWASSQKRKMLFGGITGKFF